VSPWIASVVIAANCAVVSADKAALPIACISPDVRVSVLIKHFFHEFRA